MLKRIKKIQNIGRLKACTGGEAEFGHITLLFGRNSYGKTTLGDLLASICSGNTEAIRARRSIPVDPANPRQAAELTFLSEADPREAIVRLNAERWESGLPGNLRLYVFDDGFYHTHLFAGRHITRDTKVNFSSFVLGAQGVAKAKEIAERNKQRADAVRERSKLLKAALADIEDLPEFLARAPNEPEEVLESKVLALRREYETLLKQQKNADKILTRKNLDVLDWTPNFAAMLSNLNQTLDMSLQTHHEEARKAIAEHIRATFAKAENAESWIRQGVSQNNGSQCQFCGQALSEGALRLLDMYRQSFDNSFREHEQQVAQKLAVVAEELFRDCVNAPRLIIESNAGTVHSYPELEDDESFQKENQMLCSYAAELGRLLALWSVAQDELLLEVKSARERKLAAPQAQVAQIDAEQMLELDQLLAAAVEEYNSATQRMNLQFTAFKESLLNQSVNKRLEELVAQGKAAARKWERVKREPQCSEYVGYSELISRLEAEVPLLQAELVNEQSAYIDQFFERLNRFFAMFGSQDFQLEKGKDDSGHTPVYFLKVKLKNVEVSERDLARAFSESDRRALALAVFWTSVDGLSLAEKKRSIVVLDDPVTSFDMGRITSVHQAIVAMADQLRQMIVLSHFEQGICTFLTTYRKNKPIKLLQIVRVGESSRIEAPDVEHFLRSEHDRKRANILKFACGDINEHAAGDLRVFLEVEIGYRFAKQLTGVKEENLSDRIDELYAQGAISSVTASEAHEWREILNPTHHSWTGADIEDQRHTTKRFMHFVYHRLIPTPDGKVVKPDAA